MSNFSKSKREEKNHYLFFFRYETLEIVVEHVKIPFEHNIL